MAAVEAPPSEVDQAPVEVQTETPADVEPNHTADEATGAAEATPEAATDEPESAQVSLDTPEAPKYMTAEQAEKYWTDRRAEERAQWQEEDRKQRQTENARKANAEKLARDRLARTVDTVKTTFVSRGYDPEIATDESVVLAIDRVAQEQAEFLVGDQARAIGNAWDWITAIVDARPSIPRSELDPSVEKHVAALSGRAQSLIDAIRPQIEAKAREGYTANSDLPKIREAAVAAHNAKTREGQTEIVRPDGSPTATDRSDQARKNRLAFGGADDDDRTWLRRTFPN